MSGDPEPESNLRTLFHTAQKLESDLSSLPFTSPTYSSTHATALSTYTSCQQAVSRVSLFSPNESLDDLSTSSLPYLALPYHIANLTQKTPLAPPFQPAARKEILLKSQAFYDDFLSQLSSYSLLRLPDAALYTRFQAEKSAFSVTNTSVGSDPGAHRAAKIARLRDEQGLKAKLSALRQNPDALSADEEALRSLRVAELQLQVHATFASLDMISQELAILESAPEAGNHAPDPARLAADHRERMTGRGEGGTGDRYSERLDTGLRGLLANGRAGGPILDQRGRPLQPFVLNKTRQELRDGVFRSGHRLPTMSIDEYLEEEKRRGGIIEGGGEPPVVEPDEDDIEKADAETMKKREWDEFVEENPKGSGNTLNRG